MTLVEANKGFESIFEKWCDDELVKMRLREILEDGQTHDWLLHDWLMELIEEAFLNGWLARMSLE